MSSHGHRENLETECTKDKCVGEVIRRLVNLSFKYRHSMWASSLVYICKLPNYRFFNFSISKSSTNGKIFIQFHKQ